MILFTLHLWMAQVEILYMCNDDREARTIGTYEHAHADGTAHRLVLVSGPCRVA